MALVLVLGMGGCSLFRPNDLLINVQPPEGGTVTLSPAHDPPAYRNGAKVTVTATPSDGFEFHALASGGQVLSSDGPVLELVMQDDLVLDVAFWQGVASVYDGDGADGFLVDSAGGTGVVYSLTLGSDPRDVYLVFTNVGTENAPLPAVSRRTGDFGPTPVPRSLPLPSVAQLPPARRDSPVTRRYEEEGRRRLESARLRGAPRGFVPPPPPLRDTVGQTGSFFYDSSPASIPATCRRVVGAGPTTLSIWVADADWEGTGGYVTQTMVNAMADRFLVDGASDIFGWITNVFGAEWGTHDFPADLIPNNDTITILLYDIDADGTAFVTLGGTVGFFWAKDNYFNAGPFNYSNERLMFYIDAPMLAYPTGGWSAQGYWPEVVFSTLAHEFQHMIHFYQKDVLRGNAGEAVWLNEMSSLVAEDLVSDKLLVPGPREVDPATYPGGGAGPSGNGGFLALFNSRTWMPVADWDYYAWNLESYAVNYAFGAYLARNYGGAGFFRGVVQNGSAGRAAIDAALSAAGYTGESFDSALRKWTIAVLLSDGLAAGAGYRYNTGSWILSSIGPTSYRLGSINLYNYSHGNQHGPWVWSELPDDQLEPTSSYFLLAAQDATGVLVWSVDLDPSVRLAAVVKP